MPAVKPTIGAPAKSVDNIVPDHIVLESIKQDLGLAIGDVVQITIRDEHQIGCSRNPDAAHANFDAGQLLSLVPKYLSIVKNAIVIGVFKNDNSVIQPHIKIFFAVRVGIAFHHPKAASSIGRNRNRLVNIRFSGEQGRFKPLRQLDHLKRFSRRSYRYFQFLGIGNLVRRSSF